MSDRDNQSGDFGAFLAGFVIGGLVGAAVALILAPRSGSEIRTQLMQRGEELRHRAQEYGGEYFTQTKNQVTNVASDARERVRIVLDDGQNGTEIPAKDVSADEGEDN